MLNFQNFKNATTIGCKLIFLVDEVKNNYFGFTDSISKVSYNMKMLDRFLLITNFNDRLANLNKELTGLTTIFPLGRYITVLQLNKDKSAMSMWLCDFRAAYSIIDTNYEDVISHNVIKQIQSLKYQMEELYEDGHDYILLDTVLEPPIE
jgi:hypothetical protein